MRQEESPSPASAPAPLTALPADLPVRLCGGVATTQGRSDWPVEMKVRAAVPRGTSGPAPPSEGRAFVRPPVCSGLLVRIVRTDLQSRQSSNATAEPSIGRATRERDLWLAVSAPSTREWNAWLEARPVKGARGCARPQGDRHLARLPPGTGTRLTQSTGSDPRSEQRHAGGPPAGRQYRASCLAFWDLCQRPLMDTVCSLSPE